MSFNNGSSHSLLSIVKSNSMELLHNLLSNSNANSTANSYSATFKNGNKIDTNTTDNVCTVTLHMEERDSRGRTALHLSSIRGTDDMMRLLLENGADVSAIDFHGNTPLHYCGHIETIQCLLEFGSDIYAK